MHHRLYGEIPLLHEIVTALNGKVHEWWRHDPDYTPPLPRGALRGDVRSQVYCPLLHVPRYFYLDEERSCVQCGQTFNFRASEQKYWYEALKFNFGAVPIRCLPCRRRRRSEHALREQIARARAQVRAAASDPDAHLALARALVEYHQRTNLGDLDAAVSSARKAARLWPGAAEPLYWEGLAQIRAKRPGRARTCLEAFLGHPQLRDGGLKRKARASLVALSGQS